MRDRYIFQSFTLYHSISFTFHFKLTVPILGILKYHKFFSICSSHQCFPLNLKRNIVRYNPKHEPLTVKQIRQVKVREKNCLQIGHI